MRENQTAAAENAMENNNISSSISNETVNSIEYPLCRDWELQDNLTDLCAEDIQNAWWRGDYWEGTYGIAETDDGEYSVRIEYRDITLSLVVTILDPDDSEIWWEEFDLNYYDGTALAFEAMCEWIDGKLDEISNK